MAISYTDYDDAALVVACQRGDAPGLGGAGQPLPAARLLRAAPRRPRRRPVRRRLSADLRLARRTPGAHRPARASACLVGDDRAPRGAAHGPESRTDPASSRRSRRRRIGWGGALADPGPLPDEAVLQLEEQHLVRTALSQIDERCRQLLTLLFYRAEPAPYDEIAGALGIPAGSIRADACPLPAKGRAPAQGRRNVRVFCRPGDALSEQVSNLTFSGNDDQQRGLDMSLNLSHIPYERLVDLAGRTRCRTNKRARSRPTLATCTRCHDEAARIERMVAAMRADASRDAPPALIARAVQLFRPRAAAPAPSLFERLVATLRFETTPLTPALGLRAEGSGPRATGVRGRRLRSGSAHCRQPGRVGW